MSGVFRASGGKGFWAYCETGMTEVDPYHGRIPQVVMSLGDTVDDAMEGLLANWQEIAHTCDCHRRLYRFVGGCIDTKNVNAN